MTSSQNNSMNSDILEYWRKQGRLNLLAGMTAQESLQDAAERQHRNLEAEDRAGFKALWGTDLPESEDDEMRQNILGDLINVQQSEPRKRGLGTLAALALGALIPGAGFAGYLIADALQQDPPPVIQQPGEDETADLGLGRIEDYDSAD